MPVPMTGRTRGMSSLNGPKKRGDPAKIISKKIRLGKEKGKDKGLLSRKKET